MPLGQRLDFFCKTIAMNFVRDMQDYMGDYTQELDHLNPCFVIHIICQNQSSSSPTSVSLKLMGFNLVSLALIQAGKSCLPLTSYLWAPCILRSCFLRSYKNQLQGGSLAYRYLTFHGVQYSLVFFNL